ncbi:MAG: hypothetical protein M3046_00785 [Actinomycetota bacterium]|nr:hypothetical protein [Actinomycetota bacterium]
MAPTAWFLAAATGVLVSGYVHYYLYFEGGYRGIHPDTILGLTISRSFILNAAAAVVIAESLVVAHRWPTWTLPAAAAAVAFAAGTLAAYTLTRTTGFLGFSDNQHATAAVIAVTAEIIAFAASAGVLVTRVRARSTTRPRCNVEPAV